MKKLLLSLILTLVSLTTFAYSFEVDGICYNIKSSSSKTCEVTYQTLSSDNSYNGFVIIPSTVTYNSTEYTVNGIGNSAFHGCSGLTSVTIPNSVTSIGEHAFYCCSGLTSVTIPNSVTSIGHHAFDGCYGLTSVTIPNSVTSIGSYAFCYCSGLTSVTIPNSVTSIGSYAFCYCSGLTSVTIPNNVTSIGSRAFSDCSGLTSIIWNAKKYEDLTSSSALFPVTVKSITFGDEVEKIPAYLCYDMKELTSVTIPNSVTSIGSYAFYNCSGLTSVTIPNNVTSIGIDAFYNCSGLTSVTIPNSVTSIGSGAFGFCSRLTSIKVDAGNKYYDSRNNCDAIIKTSTNELVAGCKNTIIPNNVTSIGSYAFSGCSGLTSVTIPNSVTSIGDNAFYYCSGLTFVTIPNSVTSIGNYAFGGCNKLSAVYCKSTTPPNLYTSSFVNRSNITLHVLPGYKEVYENADFWKDMFIEEDMGMTTITLGASDYATYCSDDNLDFSEVEGLKAYIASSFNPSTGALIITRIDNVPAGVGVLLKGTTGESYSVPSTTDVSVVANLMKGNTTTITLDPTDGDNTNFVLSQNNEGVIGFYRFNNSFSMPANKAWLQIPTSALGGSPAQARGFRFVEEGDELTGISDVEWKSDDNSIIYDLQGRRINNLPARGLYIQNGKKIIK